VITIVPTACDADDPRHGFCIRPELISRVMPPQMRCGWRNSAVEVAAQNSAGASPHRSQQCAAYLALEIRARPVPVMQHMRNQGRFNGDVAK